MDSIAFRLSTGSTLIVCVAALRRACGRALA